MTIKINPNLIHAMDATVLNNTVKIDELGNVIYPDIDTMRKAMVQAYGSTKDEPIKYGWEMPIGFCPQLHPYATFISDFGTEWKTTTYSARCLDIKLDVANTYAMVKYIYKHCKNVWFTKQDNIINVYSNQLDLNISLESGYVTITDNSIAMC